jgi:ribosomal protein S18 acetylase RimI-like enzyme
MLAIRPASPDELGPALELLFQRFAPEGCAGRVRHALALIEAGEIEREGVLVARDYGRLRGTMVCVSLPGAGGLVWPPQAVGDDHAGVEDELARGGLAWLRARGAKLVEALLLPSESVSAAPLLRNGFRHITRLLYLRRPLTPNDRHVADAGDLRLKFVSYAEASPAAFHETLLCSYEETQDCPELNGARHIEEIIAGHKAQGVFDAHRWWLALADGRPLGVLLMTELPEWASWDVAYVGVMREARGLGVGRALMTHALRAAAAANVGQVTLAVDERNLPARRLYARLGFEPFEEREVYLLIFP